MVPMSQLSSSQVAAFAGAVAGLLSMLSPLPSGLRFLFLAGFVLVAPGIAALRLLPPVPPSLRWLLIPAIGISVVTLASTAAVEFDVWGPRVQLVVLVALTCVLAVLRPTRNRRADAYAHAKRGAA